jgi:hypothetical protein
MIAGLVLAAGLGVGAMQNDAIAERVPEGAVDVARETKQLVLRAWRALGNETDVEATSSLAPKHEGSLDFDPTRHELLIAIARRPDHPVAKEAELVLILRAERALAAGEVERATQYLDAHRARFQSGALADNREALRVLVDRAKRSPGEARAPGSARAPSPSSDESKF